MRHFPNRRQEAALKSLLPFPGIASYLADEAAFVGLLVGTVFEVALHPSLKLL
jgi:hypothetical protein